MVAPSYLPRLADAQLTQGLRAAGAVLPEGPKAFGKMTTASHQAKSPVRLDPPPPIPQAHLGVPPSLLAP